MFTAITVSNLFFAATCREIEMSREMEMLDTEVGVWVSIKMWCCSAVVGEAEYTCYLQLLLAAVQA